MRQPWRTRTKGSIKQKGKRFKATKSSRIKVSRKSRKYKPKKVKEEVIHQEPPKEVKSEGKYAVGTLFKVKDKNGEWVYVEIEETPSWQTLKPDEIYSCTRTPWATSMYGQIESCGVTKKDRLVPLDKSDKKTVENIERAEQEGLRRSKLAYDTAKATQREREEERKERSERFKEHGAK